MIGKVFAGTILAATVSTTAIAQSAPSSSRPDQPKFRALYKELVETNTTLSSGSCTLAAQRMAAAFEGRRVSRCRSASFQRQGTSQGRRAGRDPAWQRPKAKAVLLLAHIDVVEAKREDWTRDPFKLIEEGGYFYGRGTSDDEGPGRHLDRHDDPLQTGKFQTPAHVKLALTCGEETSYAFNGASYLAAHERELIDAGFALNEGAGGRLDASGKRLLLNIQVGEKFPQSYKLEVTNPGGHSSRPIPDNAIYRLAFGLTKIERVQVSRSNFNDATRQFFAAMGPQTGGKMGAAMNAFAKNPKDDAAAAMIATDPSYNAMLHTTCIPTLLSGAMPPMPCPSAPTPISIAASSRAPASKKFAKLQELVNDPQIKVTILENRSDPAPPPPLTQRSLAPPRSSRRRCIPAFRRFERWSQAAPTPRS